MCFSLHLVHGERINLSELMEHISDYFANLDILCTQNFYVPITLHAITSQFIYLLKWKDTYLAEISEEFFQNVKEKLKD
jgi:hypothetical protein